jgi:hypothetical protein
MLTRMLPLDQGQVYCGVDIGRRRRKATLNVYTSTSQVGLLYLQRDSLETRDSEVHR